MKVAYFTPFIDWSSANLFLSRLYFYKQYKNKNGDKTILFYLHFVRVKGLEPPRLTAPDPKSGAATNYATGAKQLTSIVMFLFCECKYRTSF